MVRVLGVSAEIRFQVQVLEGFTLPQSLQIFDGGTRFWVVLGFEEPEQVLREQLLPVSGSNCGVIDAADGRDRLHVRLLLLVEAEHRIYALVLRELLRLTDSRKGSSVIGLRVHHRSRRHGQLRHIVSARQGEWL